MSNSNVWLPMDTAPKNKRILLKWGDRIECGQWEKQEYHRKPRPYWTGDCESIFGVARYRNIEPDGWMPLPKP